MVLVVSPEPATESGGEEVEVDGSLFLEKWKNELFLGI